ncbi:extracellular solute-binding protein [Candidatus Margulisiibacteriota bacterium]
MAIKRKILSFLLIFLLAFSQAIYAQDVIKLWIMPNSPRPVKDVEHLLKDFYKDNPNIRVEVTALDWGSAWTKLNTAAISKEAPDIVQLGTTWVGVFSAMGALSPLNDYLDKEVNKDTFLKAAWATSGLLGSGETTAIPWFVDARALYYRSDVFEKLGLTKEDLNTWESFENALKTIRDAKLVINDRRVFPLGVPGKNDWNVVHNIAPWIWGAGGTMLSEDLSEAGFATKEAIQGVQFYVGLTQKEYIPKSCLELNTAQVSARFNEGEYAMYFDTPAQIKTLSLPPEKGGAAGSIAAKNYEVALYPEGPAGRFTFFGGSNLCIFKSSNKKQSSWKVIKYLASKEAQLVYSKYTGFIPSRKDCFDDPYFTKHPKRKVFIEAVQYGRAYPCIPEWGPIEPILTRHIGIIWDNAAGVYGKFKAKIVKKELKSTAKEVNILLKETRATVVDSSEKNRALFLLTILGLITAGIIAFYFFNGRQFISDETKLEIKKNKHAYYFLMPTAIGMLVIHFVPVVQAFYMSFLNLNQHTLPLYLKAPFVGFTHFIDMIFNPDSLMRISGLGGATRNTIIYSIIVTIGTITVGLIVALMLNRKIKGVSILRTLFILPWVVPQYVTGLLWGFLWQKDVGIINHILVNVLHLMKEKPFWLIGTNTIWAIIIPAIWRFWPFQMIMLLAGLQHISEEYYDAAKIDGANSLQQFWYITWPLLKPVWAILVFFGLIFNVYSFNIVYMMFGLGAGYPGEWGDLLMVNLFRVTFQAWRYGAGAAASILLMLIMVIIVICWDKFVQEDILEQK